MKNISSRKNEWISFPCCGPLVSVNESLPWILAVRQEKNRSNHFPVFFRPAIHAGGRGGCGNTFEPDINGVIGRVAQVLDSVLVRWKPSGLAVDRIYFAGFSVLVRKPQMRAGQGDHHTSRMVVQGRFLMGPIMDIHDLYMIVFKP